MEHPERTLFDPSRRRFLRQLGLLTALGLCPAGLSGCGSRAPRPRHVVFISLDTVRADHLGFHRDFAGGAGVRTPNLDALAREAIVLDDLMTVVPTTLASHVSLFTGKYPHFHGVPRNGYVLNPENAFLPAILRDEGFRTAAVIGSFALDGSTGFDLGFEHYDQEYEIVHGQREDAFHLARDAAAVTDAALAWLDGAAASDRLFLFAHYFDAHAPYRPPAALKDHYARSSRYQTWLARSQGAAGLDDRDRATATAYAGEIDYLDGEIGRLLDSLREREILDDALLVVTSDHGENLKAHPQNWSHGFTVYQDTVRIAGLIRLPGGRLGGLRTRGTLANIDILPTVLDQLGLPIPEGCNGETIRLDEGLPDRRPRRRFCQATRTFAQLDPNASWRNLPLPRCVRDDRWKFIQDPLTGAEELYDLAADPGERRDLLPDADTPTRARADELRAALEAWANAADPLPCSFGGEHEERMERRLRSLGYVG